MSDLKFICDGCLPPNCEEVTLGGLGRGACERCGAKVPAGGGHYLRLSEWIRANLTSLHTRKPLERPSCPHHPEGKPILARHVAQSAGAWMCMRCSPPSILEQVAYVPPSEWETQRLDDMPINEELQGATAPKTLPGGFIGGEIGLPLHQGVVELTVAEFNTPYEGMFAHDSLRKDDGVRAPNEFSTPRKDLFAPNAFLLPPPFPTASETPLRPKGTVEVQCTGDGCRDGQWFFWVPCDDPRLPNGPFICNVCLGTPITEKAK